MYLDSYLDVNQLFSADVKIEIWINLPILKSTRHPKQITYESGWRVNRWIRIIIVKSTHSANCLTSVLMSKLR